MCAHSWDTMACINMQQPIARYRAVDAMMAGTLTTR